MWKWRGLMFRLAGWICDFSLLMYEWSLSYVTQWHWAVPNCICYLQGSTRSRDCCASFGNETSFAITLSFSSFTVHCSAVILYYFTASLSSILFIGLSSSVIHILSKFNLQFYKEDIAGWGGENKKMENSLSFLNTFVELMDKKEVMLPYL